MLREYDKLASMLTRLIVSPLKEIQVKKVYEILTDLAVTNTHPDVLWIEPETDKNLGVKDAKKIRDHLSFKPRSAKGKVVVMVGADTLSFDAQNSLLKTLEEPPETASIILTAASEENLLETIRSRVQIIREPSKKISLLEEFSESIQAIFSSSVEERFQIIEKTEDREGLFEALVEYTSKELPENPKLLGFAKKISEAEKFHSHQGNIRTILEYLMLSI